jgi:Uma2 family endonuclease
MTVVTESEYLALGSRATEAELWDGNLLLRPRDTPRHQLIISALTTALRVGRTDLHVLSGVTVRLGPGRIVVPDVIVTGAIDLDAPLVEASSVCLIGEVVSDASATVDRVLKMHHYAAAGIGWYLLAEQDTGALRGHQLSDAGYVERSVMQLEALF